MRMQAISSTKHALYWKAYQTPTLRLTFEYSLNNLTKTTHFSSYFHSQITDIIRIAKVNYVVMNLLANGHKKDSKATPEFDFTIHKYFPTIKQN